MSNRFVLEEGDPNWDLQHRGDYNSSENDTGDNLDFAALEFGFNRNDEATFLPGSQENHGQDGDSNIARAGVPGE
jgi:hypothetical protein